MPYIPKLHDLLQVVKYIFVYFFTQEIVIFKIMWVKITILGVVNEHLNSLEPSMQIGDRLPPYFASLLRVN